MRIKNLKIRVIKWEKVWNYDKVEKKNGEIISLLVHFLGKWN